MYRPTPWSLSITSHELPRSHMMKVRLNYSKEVKYLGMVLEYSRTLTPAIEYLGKAATQAKLTLQRRCQQLHLYDPGIKCKLFDTLVKPILCYGCEIWTIVGNRTDLDKLERIQQGFLKRLLGVQTQERNYSSLAAN